LGEAIIARRIDRHEVPYRSGVPLAKAGKKILRIGQFCEDFSQTGDDEVRELLAAAAWRRGDRQPHG
jgi:predicted phosphoribosyltransferase